MNTPVPWRDVYMATVFETDNDRMAGRISDAKEAIIQRLQSPIEAESDEEKELISAQDALCGCSNRNASRNSSDMFRT